MKTLKYFILVTFAAYSAGCATAPPKELVDARSAYQIASNGPAEKLAPAELHKAKESLYLAEQSFKKDPDSYKTKDLAYVAQRKSERAGALGSLAAATTSKNSANADYQAQQTELVKQGKINLSDSEKRTADAQAEIDKQAALKDSKALADAESRRQQASIAQGKQELNDAEKRAAYAQAENEKQVALEHSRALAEADKRTAESQAELNKQTALKAASDKSNLELQKQQADTLKAQQELKDSEKRTAEALASLAALATLKEEERGLVLTLSGSVLFRSDESNLLPSAQAKLDQVATALLAIRTRNLIVEGHTDSQGGEAHNQALSQRRADSVRDYLVQKGYPAQQIQSRGRSEGSPIASNSSAEGRANNRRVEIVIQRDAHASIK